MGEYKFEMIASVSDIITVDADSYDEAYNLAMEEAESYYPVAPQGYSVPWDHVAVDCISEPDEDESDFEDEDED